MLHTSIVRLRDQPRERAFSRTGHLVSQINSNGSFLWVRIVSSYSAPSFRLVAAFRVHHSVSPMINILESLGLKAKLK